MKRLILVCLGAVAVGGVSRVDELLVASNKTLTAEPNLLRWEELELAKFGLVKTLKEVTTFEEAKYFKGDVDWDRSPSPSPELNMCRIEESHLRDVGVAKKKGLLKLIEKPLEVLDPVKVFGEPTETEYLMARNAFAKSVDNSEARAVEYAKAADEAAAGRLIHDMTCRRELEDVNAVRALDDIKNFRERQSSAAAKNNKTLLEQSSCDDDSSVLVSEAVSGVRRSRKALQAVKVRKARSVRDIDLARKAIREGDIHTAKEIVVAMRSSNHEADAAARTANLVLQAMKDGNYEHALEALDIVEHRITRGSVRTAVDIKMVSDAIDAIESGVCKSDAQKLLLSASSALKSIEARNDRMDAQASLSRSAIRAINERNFTTARSNLYDIATGDASGELKQRKALIAASIHTARMSLDRIDQLDALEQEKGDSPSVAEERRRSTRKKHHKDFTTQIHQLHVALENISRLHHHMDVEARIACKANQDVSKRNLFQVRMAVDAVEAASEYPQDDASREARRDLEICHAFETLDTVEETAKKIVLRNSGSKDRGDDLKDRISSESCKARKTLGALTSSRTHPAMAATLRKARTAVKSLENTIKVDSSIITAERCEHALSALKAPRIALNARKLRTDIRPLQLCKNRRSFEDPRTLEDPRKTFSTNSYSALANKFRYSGGGGSKKEKLEKKRKNRTSFYDQGTIGSGTNRAISDSDWVDVHEEESYASSNASSLHTQIKNELDKDTDSRHPLEDVVKFNGRNVDPFIRSLVDILEDGLLNDVKKPLEATYGVAAQLEAVDGECVGRYQWFRVMSSAMYVYNQLASQYTEGGEGNFANFIDTEKIDVVVNRHQHAAKTLHKKLRKTFDSVSVLDSEELVSLREKIKQKETEKAWVTYVKKGKKMRVKEPASQEEEDAKKVAFLSRREEAERLKDQGTKWKTDQTLTGFTKAQASGTEWEKFWQIQFVKHRVKIASIYFLFQAVKLHAVDMLVRLQRLVVLLDNDETAKATYRELTKYTFPNKSDGFKDESRAVCSRFGWSFSGDEDGVQRQERVIHEYATKKEWDEDKKDYVWKRTTQIAGTHKGE